MAQINPKITIRSVYLGMLLLSAVVMILAVRLTIASELDSLKAAAEQGDANAQFYLGYMYHAGKGIPQDYVQAYAWYNTAATQGKESAKEYLETITKEMMTSTITKAQSPSREYWDIYGPGRDSLE